MAKDARKAVRSKLNAKAWIRLDGGFSVRPCTILDRSSTGVQVRVNDPRLVTDPFVLVMSRDRGAGRRCRVKWRRDGVVGAEFLAS